MPNLPTAAEALQPLATDWLAEYALADGRIVRFRHVRPEDEPSIARAITTASRETLLHRFFSPIRKVSPDLLRKLLAIDRADEACIVGLVQERESVEVVCGARYVRLPRPAAAEIAVTVHDSFQRLGLGAFLLRLLCRISRADGLRWLEAYVMDSNTGMLRLLEKVAPGQASWREAGDIRQFVIDLEALPV